jgi:hypothetical protein
MLILMLSQKVLVQFLESGVARFSKFVKHDRDSLMHALAKEVEKGVRLNAMINASENLIPDSLNLAVDLSLPNKISSVVSLLESEQKKRLKCEEKLRSQEAMFKSEHANMCTLMGCSENGSSHILKTQILNTLLALESERASRENREQAMLRLEDDYRKERQRLLANFDNERDQLAQAARARAESEIARRISCEQQIVDLTLLIEQRNATIRINLDRISMLEVMLEKESV